MTVIDEPGLGWPTEQSVAEALIYAVSALPERVAELADSLSVGVSPRASQLLTVHNSALADGQDSAGDDELSILLSSPLVEVVGDRVRLVSPLDTELARRLRERDPAHLERLHAAFARAEEAESDVDGDDLRSWQTTALIAYYVSTYDADESSDLYMASFDSAPRSSRTECRYWLADLVERSALITGLESRSTKFFRAFRLYVTGDRNGARPLLRALLNEAGGDAIAAVSSHLLALSLDPRDQDRRELLERSVSLSAQLGLVDNLIMSRQTLVWYEVSLARRGRQPERLKVAAALAAANDEAATDTGLAFYMTVTRQALATTSWLAEVGLTRSVPGGSELPVFASALSKLAEARDLAEQASDLFSWVKASIAEAEIYRSAGLLSEAATSLDDAVRSVENARAVGPLPMRQFQDELDRLHDANDGSLDDEVLEAMLPRLRRARRFT